MTGGHLLETPARLPDQLDHAVALESYDRVMATRWEADLDTRSEAARAIMMLELEARLRRMALRMDGAGEARGVPDLRPGAAESSHRLVRLLTTLLIG